MDMMFNQDRQLLAWLEEDIGSGDITTQAIVEKEQKTRAVIHAKSAGILAGWSEGNSCVDRLCV